MVGSEPQNPKFDENDLGVPPRFAKTWKLTAITSKGEASWTFKDKRANCQNTSTVQLDERFTFENEMEDGKEVLWEAANFYDVPLAAVMPLMSKMIVDVQDAQEDVLSWLLGGIEAKSYKFTNLMPLVVPESNYILRGDSFRADVLLAAYDATNAPDIFVDGDKWDGRDSTLLAYEGMEGLTIGADGMGKLRIPTRGMSLGDMTFKGLIRYQGPDGNIEPYQFYTPTITVAEPALVVSPTKMNVFYRGVPNPVEVSVPGVAQDKSTCASTEDTPSYDNPGWIVHRGTELERAPFARQIHRLSRASRRKQEVPAREEFPREANSLIRWRFGRAKSLRTRAYQDEVLSFAPVAARMENLTSM